MNYIVEVDVDVDVEVAADVVHVVIDSYLFNYVSNFLFLILWHDEIENFSFCSDCLVVMLVLLILVLEEVMLKEFDGFPFVCAASLFYYMCYILL